MSRMTDHTHTEKIGGDSISIFVVFQVVAGNPYDKGFKFLVSERVKDLIEASDAVRSLPFHFSACSAHESQKIFSFFALEHPFRVFTLKSHFSFFHFFIVLLSLENSSRTGEWFIKNFG